MKKRFGLHYRHGWSGTPEHLAWTNMKRRCLDAAWPNYKDYGGRGIRVCDAWRWSFAKFLANVGPRPSPNHSIDRIDNDGNYEPGNVRWATRDIQASNKRRPRKRAARFRGVKAATYYQRIHRGWTPEEAMSTTKFRNGAHRAAVTRNTSPPTGASRGSA